MKTGEEEEEPTRGAWREEAQNQRSGRCMAVGVRKEEKVRPEEAPVAVRRCAVARGMGWHRKSMPAGSTQHGVRPVLERTRHCFERTNGVRVNTRALLAPWWRVLQGVRIDTGGAVVNCIYSMLRLRSILYMLRLRAVTPQTQLREMKTLPVKSGVLGVEFSPLAVKQQSTSWGTSSSSTKCAQDYSRVEYRLPAVN